MPQAQPESLIDPRPVLPFQLGLPEPHTFYLPSHQSLLQIIQLSQMRSPSLVVRMNVCIGLAAYAPKKKKRRHALALHTASTLQTPNRNQ